MVIQQVDLNIRFIDNKAQGYKWKSFNTHSESPVLTEFKDRVATCRSVDEVFAVVSTYIPTVPVHDIENYGKAITAFHASVICREKHPNGVEETIEIKRCMFDK